jgi:flagellar protein FlaG
MNLVNSIGSLDMDGTRNISAETLKVVSSELQKSSTPIIVSPTGAEAAQDLVQTAADVKADAQQLQKMSDMVMGGKLRFNVNNELGSIVVKVVDPKTDQVLKEIPSVDIQKLKIQIRKAIGLLFDELV